VSSLISAPACRKIMALSDKKLNFKKMERRPIMTASDIMNSKDFKKCEAFHSHVCPGLSIGFQAARTALDRLREGRAEDEEMVAVAETDACSTDAIQVLTGFTFGNGNFIYKDHGKIVLTFFSRNTCKGIRVDLKPDAFRPDEEHMSFDSKNDSWRRHRTGTAKVPANSFRAFLRHPGNSS